MKNKTEKMNMVLTSDHQSLQLTLSSKVRSSASYASLSASNMQHPPYFTSDRQPAILTDHESKLIEHLLEVCSRFEEDGAFKQSALVDKIGMTLMQTYLSRKPNGTRTDLERGTTK